MTAKGLNKTQLQMFAVIAMVLDHTAFLTSNLTAYYLMHLIGRTTIVIMSYFVAEGYYKTSNVYKYIIRMGIFAVASQIPFYLFKTGTLPTGLYSFAAGNYHSRNVIFTLFVALCLLTVIKGKYPVFVKLAATAAALYLVRCSDWKWACVAWVLVFALFRDRPKYQMSAAAVIVVLRVVLQLVKMPPDIIYILSALIQLGSLLALPLIVRYNGEKGIGSGRLLYVFYPVHLVVLYVIKLVM